MKRLKLEKNAAEVQARLLWIRRMAGAQAWTEIKHNPEEAKLRLKRDDAMLDIFYTTMTVTFFTLAADGKSYKPNYAKVDEVQFVEVLGNPDYLLKIK